MQKYRYFQQTRIVIKFNYKYHLFSYLQRIIQKLSNMKQQNMQDTLHRVQKPNSILQSQSVQAMKQIISQIKVNHCKKVEQYDQIMKQRERQYSPKKVGADIIKTNTKNDVQVNCKVTQNQRKSLNKVLIKTSLQTEVNSKTQGVSDTDKMIFQKKFKNFLNHRQEFAQKAKEKRERMLRLKKAKKQGQQLNFEQEQYINKEQILSDEDNDNQYQNATDMLAAYEEITFGKRAKGKHSGVLFHAEKNQYLFRRAEFDFIIMLTEQKKLEENQFEPERELPTFKTTITKDIFLNYLFDEPAVMMLYSINPYQLGDQLSQFQTQKQNQLNFQQFSTFLLTDRQPTYFQYSRQILSEARNIGRGIKCKPIIAKWIADEQIYEWLMEMFASVDMMGDQKVQRNILSKKIRKEGEKKRILNSEIIQIVNINKNITLNRLLYELQYALVDHQKIKKIQFQTFLKNYSRFPTPDKDKLLTKLILSGKYDPTYIYIVSTEVLQIIKQAFKLTSKFAQFFVQKQKFLQKLVKHNKFQKIRGTLVRSQANRYVKKQNVEETLVRFMNQADKYVDIEQILDFFTNRGRPVKVEHQIYLANLRLQIQRIQEEEKIKNQKKISQGDASTSSDDQQFQKKIKQKKIQRKKERLAFIKKGDNFQEGKKFNISVPVPFSFGLGNKSNKTSIRQTKVKQMIAQKLKLQDQSMKQFKPREVPDHVKEDLFQRIMKDQERQRKQRLEKFRLQSIQRKYPVSQHLIKPKSVSVHCGNTAVQYKFIAKPLPWYCQVNLYDRINDQKQQRRERILQEIINKHSQYDLPEGVKKMIERNQKMIQRRETRAHSKATEEEMTFQPKISGNVPDFKMLHQAFECQVQTKKLQRAPIKVEPFSFQNRPSRSRTAIDHKQQHQPKLGKSRDYKAPQGDVNIPITMKYQALVQYRNKQQQQRLRKIQEEKRSNAIRKMRQQKFAPYVRQVLRKSQSVDPSKSRAIIQEKIKQFKKDQRKKKAQYEQEMIKIYTKVFNRPLLIQSSGTYGQNQVKKQSRLNNQYQKQYQNQQQIQNSKNPIVGVKLQNKKKQNKKQEESALQKYAEDYDLQEQNQNKRFAPDYDINRRRMVQQPPGNYLIEGNNERNGYDQQYDGDEDDQQYLSENGRYTN